MSKRKTPPGSQSPVFDDVYVALPVAKPKITDAVIIAAAKFRVEKVAVNTDALKTWYKNRDQSYKNLVHICISNGQSGGAKKQVHVYLRTSGDGGWHQTSYKYDITDNEGHDVSKKQELLIYPSDLDVEDIISHATRVMVQFALLTIEQALEAESHAGDMKKEALSQLLENYCFW